MEDTPKVEMTPEQYESFLDITFTDVDDKDLSDTRTFVFAVAPNFNIFISKKSHEFLAEKYGVDGDSTLTEGYIGMDGGGIPDVRFKDDIYQPNPGFKGTTEELRSLKSGIRRKISRVFSEKLGNTQK